MSRWCSPKFIHNIHGNQANNNTKVNIGHISKDTVVKLCHSKVAPPNKISLNYHQCFNVSRVHPLARALFQSNKSNSRSTSSRKTKIILFKLGQTSARSEYPKYCSRIRDSSSRIPCAGKITQSSSFDPGAIQSCQGGTQGSFVEKCNTASIAVQKLVSRQPLSCINERWGQQISNKFETSE